MDSVVTIDNNKYTSIDLIGEEVLVDITTKKKFNTALEPLCSQKYCLRLVPNIGRFFGHKLDKTKSRRPEDESWLCGIHESESERDNPIIENQKFKYELYEKLKEMHMVNQALDRHKLVKENASLCVGCLGNLPTTKWPLMPRICFQKCKSLLFEVTKNKDGSTMTCRGYPPACFIGACEFCRRQYLVEYFDSFCQHLVRAECIICKRILPIQCLTEPIDVTCPGNICKMFCYSRFTYMLEARCAYEGCINLQKKNTCTFNTGCGHCDLETIRKLGLNSRVRNQFEKCFELTCSPFKPVTFDPRYDYNYYNFLLI